MIRIELQSYHSAVIHVRMVKQYSLQLGRRHLEAANFDQLLQRVSVYLVGT